MVLLVTSMTRISYPHLELYGLNAKRDQDIMTFYTFKKDKTCSNDQFKSKQLVHFLKVFGRHHSIHLN